MKTCVKCETVCAESRNSNSVRYFWWCIIYQLPVPFFIIGFDDAVVKLVFNKVY